MRRNRTLIDIIEDHERDIKRLRQALARAGGVSDHGALTGLGDDDHTQYLLKAGGTMTGALLLQASDVKVNVKDDGFCGYQWTKSAGARRAVFEFDTSDRLKLIVDDSGGGNPLTFLQLNNADGVTLGNATRATHIVGSTITMDDPLSMSTNKITSLGTPTSSTDAATKAYADLKLSLTGGSVYGISFFRDGNGTGAGANNKGLQLKSTDGSVGSGGQITFGGVQATGGNQSIKGYLTDGGGNTRGRLKFGYHPSSSSTSMSESASISESGKWSFVQTIINGSSLRKNKSDIEDASWLADIVLEPVSFHHDIDDLDQFGLIADDLYEQDERFGQHDADGDFVNYADRAVLAVLAAKINRLEAQIKEMGDEQ